MSKGEKKGGGVVLIVLGMVPGFLLGVFVVLMTQSGYEAPLNHAERYVRGGEKSIQEIFAIGGPPARSGYAVNGTTFIGCSADGAVGFANLRVASKGTIANAPVEWLPPTQAVCGPLLEQLQDGWGELKAVRTRLQGLAYVDSSAAEMRENIKALANEVGEKLRRQPQLSPK